MSIIEINDIVHDNISRIADLQNKTEEEVICHAIADYTRMRINEINLEYRRYEPNEILEDRYNDGTEVMIKRNLIDQKTGERMVTYVDNSEANGVNIASEEFLEKHFKRID